MSRELSLRRLQRPARLADVAPPPRVLGQRALEQLANVRRRGRRQRGEIDLVLEDRGDQVAERVELIREKLGEDGMASKLAAN